MRAHEHGRGLLYRLSAQNLSCKVVFGKKSHQNGQTL